MPVMIVQDVPLRITNYVNAEITDPRVSGNVLID